MKKSKKKALILGVSRLCLVAEVGFEPHGLRVMSPTSYQAALLRDIKKVGAGNGNRTRTMLSHHGILSPGRLPIPPLRRIVHYDFSYDARILYHLFFHLSICFLKKIKLFSSFFFDIAFLRCFSQAFCLIFLSIKLFSAFHIDLIMLSLYNILNY